MRRARSRGYERGAPPCSRCAQFCARTEFAPARTLIYAGLPLPFRSTIRVRSVIGRLRFVLGYIVASQLRDEVRVLRQDAALERIALLRRHRSDVERVARLFVLRLLQLTAVHELHVGNGNSGFAGILVL
jgi:hypothetical protein